MNTQKLNELAASAMGWTAGKMMSREEYSREEVDVWKAPIGEGYRYFSKWNPCEDLNDASALLEKVAGDEGIMIHKNKSCRCGDSKRWVAWIKWGTNNKAWADADSAPLAMTLCALKASGIPESSITEATT